MEFLTNTSDLMNYDLRSSNSNNYSSFQKTSCPESFPVQMENGIFIRYELVKFNSDIIEEGKSSKNK